MILRGINFGEILGASGVQGFFGEGYWFHKFFRPFGLSFKGLTFVAKTTTLQPRKGNMPMKPGGITPQEWFPKCVKVYFRKGMMLNAVGLSGPGAKALFEMGRWQLRTSPFFISFMAVGKTPEERIAELRGFVKLFKEYLHEFMAEVGLQINYSCPNVGLDPEELVKEAIAGMEIASVLNIPLMPKFNVLVPARVVREISKNPACDAVCISNTVPWSKLPVYINWQKLFGSPISPLTKLGGGGLSGKPLLPLLIDWLREAKRVGIEKPINAGGGILSRAGVYKIHSTGMADSIFIGSVASLRPWRVNGIIDLAKHLFKKGESPNE
jgi:dihydroorotate dehydrogenase